MDLKNKDTLRISLDEAHNWPSLFMFKFIVPTSLEKEAQLRSIFDDTAKILTKTSKNGKYTSFTVNQILKSSDEVFTAYEEAGKIEGLISL